MTGVSPSCYSFNLLDLKDTYEDNNFYDKIPARTTEYGH